jgi:hypothetical protein
MVTTRSGASTLKTRLSLFADRLSKSRSSFDEDADEKLCKQLFELQDEMRREGSLLNLVSNDPDGLEIVERFRSEVSLHNNFYQSRYQLSRTDSQ